MLFSNILIISFYHGRPLIEIGIKEKVNGPRNNKYRKEKALKYIGIFSLN
jgi:hypothetical protein